MQSLFLIGCLLLGFGLWYIYYGIECAINSGQLGRNQYTMHFPLLWEEFTWLLPGGRERKMKVAHGDEELCNSLPGGFHFVFTHILIPFGPFLVGFWMVYGDKIRSMIQ